MPLDVLEGSSLFQPKTISSLLGYFEAHVQPPQASEEFPEVTGAQLWLPPESSGCAEFDLTQVNGSKIQNK